LVHEKLIELLAIPLGNQKTVAKWLVNERREMVYADISPHGGGSQNLKKAKQDRCPMSE
jgi:hypothetical protein